MLFTQKNVIEIQKVVFHGFTLHKIRSSKKKKSNHLVLRRHSDVSSDWRKTWDQQSPYKITQAHSSTLHACENPYNLAGLDNFLCSSLQPHPFHLRPQFSGHWLERLCCRPNIYSNPCNISTEDWPLFRICSLSLQSSYLKPLIHCGLKKLWSKMYSLAIRKPTGFWPVWSIYLMPRKAEAFLHLNRHVPEIADMVGTHWPPIYISGGH